MYRMTRLHLAGLALVAWSLCVGTRAEASGPPLEPTLLSSTAPIGARPTSKRPTSAQLDQAKALFERGSKAFRQGRHAEAIDAFLQADQLVPSPALSFNVAKAFEAQGNTSQSLYWYLDYLDRQPDALDADSVKRKADALGAKLRAENKQLLIVKSDVASTVYLGQRLLGTTPVAFSVEPGVAVLRLVRPGFADLVQSVEVTASGVARVNANWPGVETAPPGAPLPAASASAPAATTSGATTSSATAAAEPPQSAPGVGSAGTMAPRLQAAMQEESRSDFGDTQQTLAWIALAGGAVALGVAGGFELARSNAEDEAASARVQLDKEDALSRMSDRQLYARISGGVGAALLLGGGLLWFFSDSDDQASPASVAFHLAPEFGQGLQGVNARLSGAF